MCDPPLRLHEGDDAIRDDVVAMLIQRLAIEGAAGPLEAIALYDRAERICDATKQILEWRQDGVRIVCEND